MAKKNKYKDDYEVEEIEKVGIFKTKYKKELKYKGNYYVFQAETTQVKCMKWINLGLMCFIVALFTGIGLLNNEGSRRFYVILPYVVMFLPIFYGIMGSIKLLRVETSMTRVEYEQSVERMKKSSLSLVIMAIATAIGQVLFLFRNQIISEKNLEYVFLSGVILIGGLSLVLLQIQKRYEVVEKSK